MTAQTTTKTKLFIESLPLTTKHVSGIGHTLISLIEELSHRPDVQSQYEIILFVPKRAKPKLLQHGFKNVTYVEIPLRQRLITWLNFLGLLPAIDRWLGNGIYIFGNYTNYPLTGRSSSLTFVYDVCFMRHPELVNPKARAVLRRFAPVWIARSGKVVTTSNFSKEEITHFFPGSAKKIRVMPGGVDTKLFMKPHPDDVKRMQSKYGLPDNYVLFLSNIEPRKNLARLVEAYSLMPIDVRGKHPLVLVGSDSWLSEPIHEAIDRARAAGCKIVEPREYVDDIDLPALHSGASALALPSIYEGFGLSPLQAMACGTPVLVAQAASLPEMAADAAVYVDPLSVDDINDKLRRVLTDDSLRKQLISRGLKRAEELTWSKSATRLMEIITEPDNR